MNKISIVDFTKYQENAENTHISDVLETISDCIHVIEYCNKEIGYYMFLNNKNNNSNLAPSIKKLKEQRKNEYIKLLNYIKEIATYDIQE